MRATSIAAVSRMSWLVAPQWTYRPASSPTARVSARTSGSTGFPAARPCVGELSGIEARRRGTPRRSPRPPRRESPRRLASAAASARSASSIACSQARRRPPRGTRRGTKSRSNTSDREERPSRPRPGGGCRTRDRARPARDQRRTASRDRGEDGILGVRVLVREVHPRQHGFSSPRANTSTIRCGACAPPGDAARACGSRTRSGPSASHPDAAPAEVGAVAPVLVGLPDLDHRVRHRLALAVEHAPGQTHGAGLPGDELVRAARRAGRSRRTARRSATASLDRAHVSSGVASARRARCRSGSRAPTPARSSRGRSAQTAARAPSGRARSGRSGRSANSGSPGKYICVTSRLRERAAEEREVDVRRPPRVRVVAPRIRARLDRDEAVAAVVVGQAAAGAGEVRVERRRVLVDVVVVAAGRVRLPDLDERAADRVGRPRRARGR